MREPAVFGSKPSSDTGTPRGASTSRPASRVVDSVTSTTKAPKDLPKFVSSIAAKHGRVSGESSSTAAADTTGEKDKDMKNQNITAVIEAHRKALEERQSRMLERLQQRQQSPPPSGAKRS